jgi:hypothetical protein
MELRPGSIGPEQQDVVVDQGQEDSNHKGKIGEKMFSPWLSDIEGDHCNNIYIVDENK